MKRNKCVYEYRLPESEGGHTYYVGQGNYNRPYKPHPYRGHKRNPCIKPKDKNQIVIIKDNLTEQEAKDLEIKLIAKHGRIDLGEGYLINKTDGGEGNNGWIVSEETRRKLSEASKGKTHTEETRKKLSEASKGRIHTEESRRKMSELKKGRKRGSFTEETKRKMSEAAKGKIFTEDHRRKLSEASKNRPFVKCIHCGKSSQQPSNINRWHNDNCKHKNAGKLPI
tara:strand:+ start:104 stop:778 length:675 start_codon:yes stop_codon:yes gene_type:complete